MTVIFAKKTKDGIWLCGDRQASDASGRGFVISQPKIFNNGNLFIGYTSDFRMGQVLQYSWNPPEHEDPEHVTDMDYMVNDVIPDLKNLFEDTEAEQGTFIIIYNNNVYMIEGCSSVFKLTESAVGCGDDIAHGAMFMLGTNTNEKQMAKVCRAVAKHNVFVSAECDVIYIPDYFSHTKQFVQWHIDGKGKVIASELFQGK